MAWTGGLRACCRPLCCPAVTFLIIVGAVLQAGGFALVLLELLTLPKHVSEYEQRDAKAYPRTISAKVTVHQPTVMGGDPPSLEERIDRLEDNLKGIRAKVGEQIDGLRAKIEQEADRVQEIVSEQSVYMDRKLERLIKGAAIGNLRLRWIALVLFIGGLAVSTWGALSGG